MTLQLFKIFNYSKATFHSCLNSFWYFFLHCLFPLKDKLIKTSVWCYFLSKWQLNSRKITKLISVTWERFQLSSLQVSSYEETNLSTHLFHQNFDVTIFACKWFGNQIVKRPAEFLMLVRSWIYQIQCVISMLWMPCCSEHMEFEIHKWQALLTKPWID